MRIFIPIIVGATIGYFTNWLAIKMLFRPYYSKRIFGIKIPFTPGLIPKERDRMAKSIGEAVGVHLLSPETIIQALTNNTTDSKIKGWLMVKVAGLKKSNKSIKDMIMSFSEKTYFSWIKSIENSIISIITSKIKEEKFKAWVYKAIEERIMDIDMDNTATMIKGKLREIIGELYSDDQVKIHVEELIRSKLDDLATEEMKLSQKLPEELVGEIYQAIDHNENAIGRAIRSNFKDPAILEEMGSFITDLVLQHVPKIILTFVEPDIISKKILQIIEKYVDNEETDKYIISFIKASLDKLLDSKVKDLISNIELKQINIEKLGDGIMKTLLAEENQNLILHIVDKKLRSLENVAKVDLLKYIDSNIRRILESEELENSLSNFVQDIVTGLAKKPINSLADKVDENHLNSIYEFSKMVFHEFAKEELPEIIEFFNISMIVEDKINSFDVDFTEELILDIAHRELKAITWLGGLLGGILGMLTPLLQLIY